MLNGSPLPANLLIRDFQKGKARYVVDPVEQALLLPENMVDFEDHEETQSVYKFKKRPRHGKPFKLCFFFFFFLGFFILTTKFSLQVVQVAFKAEEMVDVSHQQMKDEEARRIAAVEAFKVADKREKETDTKLIEAKRNWKSAEAAMDNIERQAETQCKQLCLTEDELTTAQDQIKLLKKKLKDAEKAKDRPNKKVTTWG